MTARTQNDHRHAASHRRGHSLHRIITGIASLASASDHASQTQRPVSATAQTLGCIARRHQARP